MNDDRVHELLERYLAGECAPAERQRVELWIQADPARGEYVESLRALGETWARARPQFDSQRAWRRVAERAMPEASPSRATRVRPLQWGAALQAPPRRIVARRWAAAGAVAAAAIFGAVVVGPRLRPVESILSAPQEYVTAAGQQMALTLPDGTKVRLGPRTRLVVDGEYGRAARTVELTGQAYFDVLHNDAHPFRVRAGNTVAWDLGTKFTVRAYEGEPLRLAVTEGSVAIPQALKAPLLPGDVAIVDSAGRGHVERGTDLSRYTSWVQGTLEFRDTPMSEAMADLSRWYGVEVRLADPALIRRRITVTVTDTSIDAALELIAPAVGARHERHGRAVTLYALEIP